VKVLPIKSAASSDNSPVRPKIVAGRGEEVVILSHHKHKNKMKTIFLTLTAGFLLLTGNIFAANISPEVKSKYECSTETSVSIAPQTPNEATFEDSPVADFRLNMVKLAPLVPREADFSDSIQDSTSNLQSLAPKTPGKADFDEFNQ
jgi:hypothetical protein